MDWGSFTIQVTVERPSILQVVKVFSKVGRLGGFIGIILVAMSGCRGWLVIAETLGSIGRAVGYVCGQFLSGG